ncbi:MAG: hypothetical protein Q8Q37_02675 [bacterium]|nr:hypothetical protein [bacterium]
MRDSWDKLKLFHTNQSVAQNCGDYVDVFVECYKPGDWEKWLNKKRVRGFIKRMEAKLEREKRQEGLAIMEKESVEEKKRPPTKEELATAESFGIKI